MNTYLVWYVIQTTNKASWEVNDLMGKMWMWNMDTKNDPIFKSNKIKVKNVDLPSIYKYLAKKNNIWAGAITILGVSKID